MRQEAVDSRLSTTLLATIKSVDFTLSEMVKTLEMFEQRSARSKWVILTALWRRHCGRKSMQAGRQAK